MANFLGIDLGTSSVKALLVDGGQRPIAHAAEPLVTLHPAPLASEQEPEDWIRAVEAVLARLHAAEPGAMSGVAALGVSGQMHAALLLDRSDRPVRPAMLWNDGRAEAEARELNARSRDLARRLGVSAMPGFTAPKLAWLARHEPAAFARARCLLLTADYVRLRLTGERACSVSDAAGTWLLDQERRNWSAEAVSLAGIDPALLPPLIEGSAVAGKLRPDIAARFGLPAGCVVAGGGGDTAVAGIGVGAVGEGASFVQLGTAAQIFVAGESYRPAPERMVHAFCHALQGRWYGMAALLNGASVLAVTARLLGYPEVGAMLAEAEREFHGPSRLLYLPYLAGERTPHDDPFARGTIVGLGPETDRAEIVLAALEGVAFALADGLAALAAAGVPVSAPGLIGGGARSRLWARLIASILDLPLKRYVEGEFGPAFGAARLARLALGRDSSDALLGEPPVAEIVVPERALAAAYAPRLEAFRRVYGALQPEYRAMAIQVPDRPTPPSAPAAAPWPRS